MSFNPWVLLSIFKMKYCKILLEVYPRLIKPDGGLVLLRYHSIEDHFTKHVTRDGTIDGSMAMAQEERYIYEYFVRLPKPCKPVGKDRKAHEEEIFANSCARSTTLRIVKYIQGQNIIIQQEKRRVYNFLK